MLYRFIGAGDDPPQSIVFMGRYPFTLNGDPVDVTDPEVLAKIAHNPSFDSVAGRSPDPAPPVPSDDPEALRAILEARGAKVDGRWGVARLKQEVADG